MAKCDYDPTPLLGEPIGMFHCPLCGEMVLAGFPHPDYEDIRDNAPEPLAEPLPDIDWGETDGSD